VHRTVVLSIAALSIGGLVTVFAMSERSRASQSGLLGVVQPAHPALLAAPGRVEPISEEIAVGSEISGQLTSVLVEEGDLIQRGQLIAVLNNADYRAQVAAAEARLRLKTAELRRVLNGARQQERREAWEAVKEADAVRGNARADMERRQQLYRQNLIAREEAERAEREYKVARARAEAAAQRYALTEDKPREEDRAQAEAAVALARAQQDEARARMEKTFIRSPITGVVLRKHLKAGETVSSSPGVTPTPIITVADVSILRVRIDVDEADVSKVKLGQRVYVRADAYGHEQFWGRVIRIGQVLGKKNIHTDQPTERMDTKILETLIELDDGHGLYPGLRVDAFILVTESSAATIGGPRDQRGQASDTAKTL
jgi:HlyD family secretion protein